MPSFDVAVIGAGVFGAWTSLWLARAGKSVLLVDAWGPGHARSSSGGESRVIRMGYGADHIYTDMAIRSLAHWQDLFRRTNRPLFHQTGVVWMSNERDLYGKATCETLLSAGIRFEVLSARDLGARYPQMRLSESDVFGILEPASGAIMARRAVATVVEAAIQFGVTYETAQARLDLSSGSKPHVRLNAGDQIEADKFVFACGPWLPKLFPELLGSRIFSTRQEVFFFAPPAGDSRFEAPHLPVWIDFTDSRGPYGFPDIEARGVKLAFDRHGAAFDPDSDDRLVGEASVEQARCFLAERFPDLRDARLTESRVCQYENTSNGDFLVDRHPGFEDVWLAGGGSGHGFKHGPCVGEYACWQIMDKGVAGPRFSLDSKEVVQRRTVF
jgi:sarcosine oxidase